MTKKQVLGIGDTTFNYDITAGLSPGNSAEKYTDPKGNVVTRESDKAGRLYKVTADASTTTYGYYDNGTRKKVTYQTGVSEEYSYYSNNLLKELKNLKGNGSVMDCYTYTYDLSNNMERYRI